MMKLSNFLISGKEILIAVAVSQQMASFSIWRLGDHPIEHNAICRQIATRRYKERIGGTIYNSCWLFTISFLYALLTRTSYNFD